MPETNTPEAVGKIIVLSGSATAQSSTGERLLKIGDPVFKNDIIKTDVGSKVQIRFADNTQVSQDENSSLAIDNFVYNPDPADNSDLLLNMMKGTFRTITGEITKDSPTSFMLKSPQSTIGIRGTIVVSEVTSLYEKHGVSELTPGKILVITDNYGNVRILKVPMKIVEFFKGKPVGEVRDMLLKELEEINEKTPLDLGEKDTPLGYTPPDDFVGGLDQGVDILGADVVPSDFGLTGNMVLFSTEGPGLLGVFDSVDDIPGYVPDSGTGDQGDTGGSNENVIPGVNDYTISENQSAQDEADDGNTIYTFNVTRTGDVENPADVEWSVIGSGANPADGDDFVGGGLPSGTLHFNANDTDGTITVTVAGDTDFEFDESFSLVLSYPSGTGTGTVTTTSENVFIQNDDPAIYEITAVESVQAETDTGDITFTFTITRPEDIEVPASVNWSVEGTGVNPADGDDFIQGVLPSGILNFAAGQTTQDVTVTVSGDTDFEFDESFSLVLSDPSGTFITTSDNVTIQNDDSPHIALAELEAEDGFRVDGIESGDNSGYSVSNAGDVNGDGFDDFIIGAYGADGGESSNEGASYLVFGGENGIHDWSGERFSPGSLNGENGFRIEGIDDDDNSGWSVSNAGDVNGDGYADLIIGAYGVDYRASADAGESYVVLGGEYGVNSWVAPNSVLYLDDLGDENGFRIEGIDEGDNSGWSVSSAGDVNGDGFDDLIIGAPHADGDGNDFPGSGEAYLVFGGVSENINLDDLDGDNGIKIYGVTGVDQNGWSVSSAGDINSDGYDDFLIGAYHSDPRTGVLTGESYLVLGGENGIKSWDGTGDSFSLGSLNGENGFQINGISNSVSDAGDINGDGYDDFVFGYADTSYLVFGGEHGVQNWSVALDSFNLGDLDGNNGFFITGIDSGVFSEISVSGAGDINGDGFDDLIIGAHGAGPSGNFLAGESYLVFGGEFGVNGWSASDSTLDLGELDGVNGFQIEGIELFDLSGSSVSAAGDINGDGFDDLIIGAYGADSGAGESYIIFGGDFTYSVDEQGGSVIGTTSADVLIGGLGDDLMLGLGGLDVMYGGAGNDIINVSDFFRVDGGSGFDTLELDGLTLDLGAVANNKIEGIEKIDLGIARYENNLTLDISDVLDMSDTTNTLIVGGDGDDSLTVSDGEWYHDSTMTTIGEDGRTYDIFTDIGSEATLHIDTQLTNLTITPAIV